ncbi:MAG: hypothetical protein ACPGYX_09525, partial [Oceanobacter sp.]
HKVHAPKTYLRSFVQSCYLFAEQPMYIPATPQFKAATLAKAIDTRQADFLNDHLSSATT